MNKRFMKVITLILSCLLLIGAAVGITVAAEDNAPAVSIEKKNVAYEGAIQLVYLVTANNLPEGAAPLKEDAPERREKKKGNKKDDTKTEEAKTSEEEKN